MAAGVETAQFDTDVLVIGGGFAGVWAAIRAAESGSRVILVEKAYVSRSGCSTMSGGVTTAPVDPDALDAWVEEFVTRGHYMCDQRWTRKLLEGQRERVRALDSWGVPISKDEHGAIRRFASRGMVAVRCLQFNPKKAMEELRRQVLARGVTIIDRVIVTDLLTSDGAYPTKGHIVGAIGFETRGGRCIVLRAKQTIMATGPMAMKGSYRVDNDAGDGMAIGYRAGARVVDLEFGFGGTFSYLMKDFNLGGYNVAVAHGARLINARGERFMEKYDPVRFERSELARVVAAFGKELMDGRGPVFIDFRHCDPSYWADMSTVQTSEGSLILLSGEIPDPRVNPLPIEPTWGLWNGGRGGLKIDIDCQTSLPGLLAAGVAAKNDATGTHASAGIPTAFAMNTGYFAGETAANAARDMDMPEIPEGLVAELRARMFEPLARNGSTTPDDLLDMLAATERSVIDSMLLNERKLIAMRNCAEEVLAATTHAVAADLHDLVKLHEARTLAQCAQLTYALGIDRTESREQFYREDYPETDDDTWFCWHGVTRTAEGQVFDRIPIPLDGPLRPEKSFKGLSPIAAMMGDCYDPAVYG
jgi:succinate dehydrogenase / fumarate reductase flavoprotein subunit